MTDEEPPKEQITGPGWRLRSGKGVLGRMANKAARTLNAQLSKARNPEETPESPPVFVPEELGEEVEATDPSQFRLVELERQKREGQPKSKRRSRTV